MKDPAQYAAAQAVRWELKQDRAWPELEERQHERAKELAKQALRDELVLFLGAGVSQWQGFVIEIVLTFFLVWVVFATAADPGGTFKSIAGLAIGLTITLDVLMGGPLTGAAMNPARAFGPQLVQNDWTKCWVWYAGPVVGASAAALIYEWLYLRMRPLPVGPPETGVTEPRPGETAVS